MTTRIASASSHSELEQDPLDKLQAGLFYLMTQYTFNHSPTVAAEIVDQVNALLRHPHIELLPAQRAMLAAILNKWRIHRSSHTQLRGEPR